MRPIYFERYGVTIRDRIDLKNLRRAEAEIATCASCNGLPCNKAQNQLLTPIIDKDAWDFVAAHECKWRKLLTFKGNCRLASIPSKYAGRTFGDYIVTNDNQRAVNIAQSYVKDKPPKSLFFFGGCGTGKTFLASLIAKEFIGAGKTVIFGDVPELLDELKRTFDAKDVSTQELLNKYCDCDLLVLDDIGAGQMTAWGVGILYKIINRRYNAGRAIVVTSNFDLEDLNQRLSSLDKFSGERVISRLYEMCVQGFFGTKDRRKET